MMGLRSCEVNHTSEDVEVVFMDEFIAGEILKT